MSEPRVEIVRTRTPDHLEARALGARFRHLHRPVLAPRDVKGGIRKGDVVGYELAATIASRDLGDGNLECTMVVVNPHDVRPRAKDSKDVLIDRLRAALFLMVPDVVLAIPPGTAYVFDFIRREVDALVGPTQVGPVSKRAGRQRAWERLQNGPKVVMPVASFKSALVAGTIAHELGVELKMPPKVIEQLGSVRGRPSKEPA